MLDVGLVVPVSYAWLFSVVTASKTDGKLSFCADYSTLTQASKQNGWPLLNIEKRFENSIDSGAFTTTYLFSC